MSELADLFAAVVTVRAAAGRILETTDELAELWAACEQLEELARLARECRAELGDKIGTLADSQTVDAGSVLLHVTRKKQSVRWDDFDLMEAVLDVEGNRLIDRETGEVIPETLDERLLAVYGSREQGDKDGPRRFPGRMATKSELEARGIDAKQFQQVTWADGWEVRPVRA